MTDPAPDLPARPLLRPGVRVCRRSADELQVGLADDLAVRLPDSADVRALLDGLQQGRPLPGPPAIPEPNALGELLAHGLVVDGDLWCTRLGAADAPQARARTAAIAEAGLDAAARFDRRAEVHVGIDTLGLPEADARLRELLDAACVPLGGPGTPDLVVLMREGELDRGEVDDLLRLDQPHLFLTVSEGRVRVGPFVHPTITACLRCVDAHLREADPRRCLVVQQYADTRGASVCGLPEPVPADLLDVAVGLVARDVTRWADCLRPATWSTTIDVDPELTLPRTYWRRHQGCGCSTIGALVG